jgi:hypothetical protein
MLFGFKSLYLALSSLFQLRDELNIAASFRLILPRMRVSAKGASPGNRIVKLACPVSIEVSINSYYLPKSIGCPGRHPFSDRLKLYHSFCPILSPFYWREVGRPRTCRYEMTR